SLLNVLTDPARPKAAHDLKPLLLALRRARIATSEPPTGRWFDTMIAAYLLNPNRRTHTLESIALDTLGYQMGTRAAAPAPPPTPSVETEEAPLFAYAETVKKKNAKPDPPRAELAAEGAAVIAKLMPLLHERLAAQQSLRLFEDVEMPLVPVLADIEQHGFALDLNALAGLGKELDREIDRVSETITRLAGEEFNFNSPKQLATVLFEKLGLKPLRKTKTGYSTDEDTLTQLATQHELPAQILACRSLSKLKSTYVDALPALVNRETGRLHTSLNQTVAATGRLSSTEPNLQNIPVKGEYGLRIREAFIAPPGRLLIAADYSQIEPRILAHLSRDERL